MFQAASRAWKCGVVHEISDMPVTALGMQSIAYWISCGVFRGPVGRRGYTFHASRAPTARWRALGDFEILFVRLAARKAGGPASAHPDPPAPFAASAAVAGPVACTHSILAQQYGSGAGVSKSRRGANGMRVYSLQSKSAQHGLAQQQSSQHGQLEAQQDSCSGKCLSDGCCDVEADRVFSTAR